MKNAENGWFTSECKVNNLEMGEKTCDTFARVSVQRMSVSVMCIGSAVLVQWSLGCGPPLYLDRELSDSCACHEVKRKASTYGEKGWSLFVGMHSAHLCHNNSSGWWTAPEDGNERWDRVKGSGSMCLVFLVAPLPSKRDRPQVQTAQLTIVDTFPHTNAHSATWFIEGACKLTLLQLLASKKEFAKIMTYGLL